MQNFKLVSCKFQMTRYFALLIPYAVRISVYLNTNSGNI